MSVMIPGRLLEDKNGTVDRRKYITRIAFVTCAPLIITVVVLTVAAEALWQSYSLIMIWFGAITILACLISAVLFGAFVSHRGLAGLRFGTIASLKLSLVVYIGGLAINALGQAVWALSESGMIANRLIYPLGHSAVFIGGAVILGAIVAVARRFRSSSAGV